MAGRSTPYVDAEPARSRIDDFAAFLAGTEPGFDTRWREVLKAELIGRPVGAPDWVRGLEQRFGREFSPRKRGPKPRAARSDENASLLGN
jgi:hypothetical protein